MSCTYGVLSMLSRQEGHPEENEVEVLGFANHSLRAASSITSIISTTSITFHHFPSLPSLPSHPCPPLRPFSKPVVPV